MRNALLAVVLWVPLALAGCSDRSAERLVGTWVVNIDAIGQGPEIEKLPEPQRKQALEILRGILGRTELEFTADTLRIRMGSGKAEEATFKVKAASDEAMVLTSQRAGSVDELRITFKPDDQIALQIDGRELVLKRK